MTQFIKKNDENMFNVFAENANIEIYEKKIFTPASKINVRFFLSYGRSDKPNFLFLEICLFVFSFYFIEL